MANMASVDMVLWDKHSNACLESADEIERLLGENKKLQAESDYYHGEWQKVIVAISDKSVHMKKLEDCLREIRQLTNEVLS